VLLCYISSTYFDTSSVFPVACKHADLRVPGLPPFKHPLKNQLGSII